MSWPGRLEQECNPDFFFFLYHDKQMFTHSILRKMFHTTKEHRNLNTYLICVKGTFYRLERVYLYYFFLFNKENI